MGKNMMHFVEKCIYLLPFLAINLTMNLVL
ncbi:hypothetical protein SAMN05443246_1821 [Paenibacillus sp. GP183]|jgi:hypothetical protein|nr:hypothetical protein SAMN05443246_1821 [Paenibacillus sp. GP183]